jgi:hypothetical protein
MNIVKINRGKVELRNSGGILQRIITEGAQNAFLSNSEDMVLVTKLNGRVDLRQIGGMLIRVITEDARDARFYGNDILIQKSSKTELRDVRGNLIRYI